MLPAYLLPAEAAAPPCRDCKAEPAVRARFRQTVGLVIAWRNHWFERMVCRDCGIALGNDASRRTMRTGWLTIFAPIVNTITLLRNAREVRRLRGLPAPTKTASH